MRATHGLKVARFVAATEGPWPYVVKRQILGCAADDAPVSIAGVHESTHRIGDRYAPILREPPDPISLAEREPVDSHVPQFGVYKVPRRRWSRAERMHHF